MGTEQRDPLSKGVKTVRITDQLISDWQIKEIKMTMKKMFILLIGFMVLVLNLDAARRPMRQGLDGQGQRGYNGMMMLRMLDTHAQALGLSEQQQQEIKTLCTTNAELNVAVTNKNNLLKLELDKLMLEEKRDYAKIKDTMNKMSENRIERRLNALKIREKIMTILTPEQRKMISEKFGAGMERHQRSNRPEKRGSKFHRSDRPDRNID